MNISELRKVVEKTELSHEEIKIILLDLLDVVEQLESKITWVSNSDKTYIDLSKPYPLYFNTSAYVEANLRELFS